MLLMEVNEFNISWWSLNLFLGELIKLQSIDAMRLEPRNQVSFLRIARASFN